MMVVGMPHLLVFLLVSSVFFSSTGKWRHCRELYAMMVWDWLCVLKGYWMKC